MDVAEAVRTHQDGRRPVYDVRFDSDRRDLDLPGAVHRPIDRLSEWLPQADAESPLVVCGAG